MGGSNAAARVFGRQEQPLRLPLPEPAASQPATPVHLLLDKARQGAEHYPTVLLAQGRGNLEEMVAAAARATSDNLNTYRGAHERCFCAPILASSKASGSNYC